MKGGILSVNKNGTAAKYNEDDGLITFQVLGKGAIHHVGIKDAANLVELLQKAIGEAKQAQENKNGLVPQGRVEVKGTIISKEYVENKYTSFGTLKMLVKLENNSTVWGTVPRGLYNQIIRHSVDIVGCEVQFFADFTRERRNPSHGYFKRPTKSVLLNIPKKEDEVVF